MSSPPPDDWLGPETRRRATIVLWASLSGAVLTLGLAGTRWVVEGLKSRIGAMVFTAALLFAFVPFVMRATRSVRAGGDLLLGAALITLWLMALLEEGLGSEAMLWLPFVALSASFFQGGRAVFVWGALALFAVATITLRDLATAVVGGRGLVALHSASAVGVILFGAVLGWAIEAARTRTQRAIVAVEVQRLEEQQARQMAEREYQAAAAHYRTAAEAVRARDEFLSIASHELNTPLTALQLTTQALAHGMVAPDAVRSAAERIDRQAQKLSRLVDELLSVSRIQGGQLHLELESVDLVSVAREVIDRFGDEAAQAHSAVTFSAPTSVVGRWDRLRLEQVLSNLLANALKFGNGQPIELVAEQKNGRARMTVTDHGIGIPPDRLPHIFERFERAVSARQYGGLGLGLYIVRQIAAAFGGSVTAQSTPGTGATFTLELPLSGPAIPAEVAR